jgi:hypothetical protein
MQVKKSENVAQSHHAQWINGLAAGLTSQRSAHNQGSSTYKMSTE